MSLQLTGLLETLLTLGTLVYGGLCLLGGTTRGRVDMHVLLQMAGSFESFMANLSRDEQLHYTSYLLSYSTTQ